MPFGQLEKNTGETNSQCEGASFWQEEKYSHMVPVRQRPRTRTFMGTMRLHWVLSMSVPSLTRTGVPRIPNPAILNLGPS